MEIINFNGLNQKINFWKIIRWYLLDGGELMMYREGSNIWHSIRLNLCNRERSRSVKVRGLDYFIYSNMIILAQK
jgi:hypothetical protein